MERSKKILFSIITFIVLSLIIILCLYSYNNLDNANAFVADTNDTIELAFPYDNSRYSLIYSNLVGTNENDNDGYFDEIINTTGYTSNTGVKFVASDTFSHYPSLTTYFNTYNDVIYNSCRIYDGGSYFNGYRNILVSVPMTFLQPNSTYTFSFALFNYNYPYTTNSIFIDFVDINNVAYNNVYATSFDYVGPFNFPSKFIYFTFNTGNVSYKNLVIHFRSNLDFNFYCVKGSTPIFSDSTSFVTLSNWKTGNNNYAYSSINVPNGYYILDVSGNNSFLSFSKLKNIALSQNSVAYCEYDYNNNHYKRTCYLYYNSSSDIVQIENIAYNTGGTEYTNMITFRENYFSFNNTLPLSNYKITICVYQYYDSDNSVALNQQYNIGYNKGVKDGMVESQTYYNSGYNDGYTQGLSTASNSSFLGLITASIESPLNAVLNMFDFEILGFNMKTFYLGLFSVALILFLIKVVLGNVGGKKDG